MSATDLIVQWLLPVLATLLLLFPLRSGWPGSWPAALWTRGRLPVFVLTRLGYAILLFVALDYRAASDAWAWKQNTVFLMDGQLPGRDFENLYGPLYYYLLAAGRWVTPGHHWVGTLFPLMVGDLIAVWCGAKLGRRLLGAGGGRWIGAWLLVSPLLWHQLVVRGQDESLFLGCLLAGVCLIAGSRVVAGATVLALGMCANKMTFAPYALVVLVALAVDRPRDLRPWLVFGCIAGVVYGAFTLLGAPLVPVGNLSAHTVNFSAGVSIPDAVARVFPAFPPGVAIAGYALSMLVVSVGAPLFLMHLPLLPRIVAALAAVHAASLLTMPFCVSPYVAQGIAFPLLFLASLPREHRLRIPGLVFLAVLGCLCALHLTGSRVFSIPMKPACIGFSVFVVLLVLKARPRRSR